MKIRTASIRTCSDERGIALIIVMLVIVVLAVLAGGFAYSMKVETRLARNTSFDSDLENLGRSGVEYARWILAQQLRDPDTEQRAYTGRKQAWGGGPANTNEPLLHVVRTYEMSPGKSFTWEMTDMESKFNLSVIRDERFSPVLQRALELIGTDPLQATDIVEAYLDWVDPDDNKRAEGAESDFYMSLNPDAPYVAKNGLMDDVSEFLLLRGMTREIYFGYGLEGPTRRLGAAPRSTSLGGNITGGSGVGLKDLFTTISAAGMGVNVHTASAEVLQILPGMDAELARGIIDARSGPDHIDGTEDDIPFLRQTELINVPGMTPEVMQAVRPYLVLNSSIFQVMVEARVGEQTKRYESLLFRRNFNEITILYFRVF
ncbi:MAG: general secretion pathway protein GspK [Limisphaerales bacterium]